MRRSMLAWTAVLCCFSGLQAQERKPNPVPYAPDEPFAASFSLAKGIDYLDTVGRFWMRNSCGDCHANHTYLLARPFEAQGSAATETRRFLEKRLTLALDHRRTSPRIQFDSEIVGIAAGLAFDDARTGKLQPTTRQALDHMWKLQMQQGTRLNGTWRCGCGEFPTVELDPEYAAILAALAAGIAPEGYAREPQAQDGLTRLRRYLMANKPPHLHHQAMLLWASLHLDGLMTSEERAAAVQALLARQRPDGGWSKANLSGEGGAQQTSDGYGTGFALYILRQAGVPANRPAIVRGVRWLHLNQRASGGWFTPSHHVNQRPEAGHGTRELALLNATAAFAVLALQVCEETDVLPPPRMWEYQPKSIALRRTGFID